MDIAQNATIGLIGRNGASKTTLMRTIQPMDRAFTANLVHKPQMKP